MGIIIREMWVTVAFFNILLCPNDCIYGRIILLLQKQNQYDMLELKNVAFSHSGKILQQGLSFVAERGKVTAVSGPSGCGKTTMVRAVLGFHPVDKGFISIDGELVTALSAQAFRQMTAYVPQDLSFPQNSVRELVELPFLLKANSSLSFSRERVFEQWHRLGLDSSLYDKRLSDISGGERQRIMIANLGLLGKPLVLVDEPTSALDSQSAHLVATFLQDLALNGAAVLAVTHSTEFISDKRILLP